MKKKYSIIGLDCANCALKLNNEISKLHGVSDVNVNFLTQRIVLNIDDRENYDEFFKMFVKTCKKVERDCEISEIR